MVGGKRMTRTEEKTQRDRQVVELLWAGSTPKEVAHAMNYSYEHVIKVIQELMRRYEVRTHVGLVRKAKGLA